MAVSDTDLLLVQRGTVPYKTTAANLASYSNTKIELGDGKDIPIASASQLGVIKVGANLDITSDGTLSAVIPAGLTYKGTWTDAANPPTPAANGDFYIWDGADGTTLNSNFWGTANGQTVNEGDRLFYDGNSWSVISSGGGGLTQITGTAPVAVSSVVGGEQNVSMPAANATTDGYMPKEAWAKLDGIEAGAEVNVNPTQTFAASPANGTLTLTPGGDTTVIPLVDGTNAGLMSPADKTILDNLVSSPGGVSSVLAGFGIDINTTTAPGSAGTPEVNVKFAGTGADATTLVMPGNIQLLEDLP